MSIDVPALVVVGVLTFLAALKVTMPASVARRIHDWSPGERSEAALYLRRRDLVLPWAAAAVTGTAAWSTWTLYSPGWDLWALACVVALVLVAATRSSADRLERVLGAHDVPLPADGDPADTHRRTVDRWRSALVVAFAATWIVRLLATHSALADVTLAQTVLLPAVAVCAGRLAWLAFRGPREDDRTIATAGA